MTLTLAHGCLKLLKNGGRDRTRTCDLLRVKQDPSGPVHSFQKTYRGTKTGPLGGSIRTDKKMIRNQLRAAMYARVRSAGQASERQLCEIPGLRQQPGVGTRAGDSPVIERDHCHLVLCERAEAASQTARSLTALNHEPQGSGWG